MPESRGLGDVYKRQDTDIVTIGSVHTHTQTQTHTHTRTHAHAHTHTHTHTHTHISHVTQSMFERAYINRGRRQKIGESSAEI